MFYILAIDDEPDITDIIKEALSKDDYEIEVYNNAKDVKKESLSKYDLILLDVMMPDIDGFSFCKEIRGIVDCPIVFITAKTMEHDVVEGLMLGGDDYIKKPFGIFELRARVESHLRRENREKINFFTQGEYKFDLPGKKLMMIDEVINLTKTEYMICEYLAKNKGQVFSLEQILESTLGFDSESDTSAIREHVKNIRNKISKYGENPIETIWGIGYKWK
ncbi:response regulator transcription factor [Peptostreptococcus faecalis]|uniref:response regulator transcription factor n=1 Tax=Peptostreptococcus faecalis TaxID=2045015 RepID=UPI000C7C1D02|nr:response regulator transcription factor [Peptostreptococcus faecalis]